MATLKEDLEEWAATRGPLGYAPGLIVDYRHLNPLVQLVVFHREGEYVGAVQDMTWMYDSRAEHTIRIVDVQPVTIQTWEVVE